MRIQNGLPVQKFNSGAKRGDSHVQDIRVRTLSSVDAKGAESGAKGRQIRPLFHPDVQILRILSRLEDKLTRQFHPVIYLKRVVPVALNSSYDHKIFPLTYSAKW